jgi:DMSO/TMAO reductase YedYZ molybdopterin-dependent catalytic subunit
MSDQLKIVTQSPQNAETPLADVHGWVTPTRLFFVRNHFAVPQVDLKTWRLSVSGRVGRPLELTYDELNQMPQRSVLATLECAGNGRSFLAQKAPGVQWSAGAVAHAEWTGVPLRDVLELAGIDESTVEVVGEAADIGTEPDHPEPMHFARGLPLAKAMHRDTILALRMNGERLTPSHGFPLRLLVPGWYGVASIKWLTRLEASPQPFRGYFQTIKYTIKQTGADGRPEIVPLQKMAVKSEIVRPFAGEALGLGKQRVFGLAWAGEESVAKVEVSTSGGQSWHEAELLGPGAPYSWMMWEYVWNAREAGSFEILSRATTTNGTQQPTDYDPNYCGYMIHFSRPIPVRVESHVSTDVAASNADVLRYDMNAFAEANARRPLDVDLEFSLGAGI